METLENIYNNLTTIKERIKDFENLSREYTPFVNRLQNNISDTSWKRKCPPHILWNCWLQGIEQAPALVQRCYKAWSERYIDYQHIFLTKDNLWDYITIHPVIREKWEAGLISNTAFSNLVRLQLLRRYGGIWMDSTVFCTAEYLPEYMTQRALFLFSSWTWITVDIRPISTWLMASCSNHPLLWMVEKCLTQYWMEKDRLQTYFIFHMFFRMVIERYPSLWEAVPRYSNVPPHLMQFELSEKYDSVRYRELQQMSPVHKLTYKLNEKTCKNSQNLYSHILRKGTEL